MNTAIKKWMLLSVIVTTTAGTWVWLNVQSPARPSVQDAQEPNVESAPSPAPQVSAAAQPRPPRWEEQLNHILGLIGKVSDAELDLAINDLAASLPDEEAIMVLDLQLAPGTDASSVISTLCMVVFRKYAERAPRDAATWLSQMPENTFSRAAHHELARIWGQFDFYSALEWWKDLPENGNKTVAQPMIAEWAANSQKTDLAIDLLSPLPPGPDRDRLLCFTARKWAIADRNSALAWINQEPHISSLREKMLGDVALDWSVNDPAGASAFVTTLPPGKNQENAATNVARFWAVNAPEQAAAWAEGLPEGPLRTTALEGVAETWARNNLQEAAAWLHRLAAGPSRDAAVGMFVPLIAKSSPDSALRWIETIQDPAIRDRVREDVKPQ